MPNQCTCPLKSRLSRKLNFRILIWKTDFNTVVVTDSFERFTAELSASAPVVYTNPPPLGPEILYTTGAGEGVKVSMGSIPSSCGV